MQLPVTLLLVGGILESKHGHQFLKVSTGVLCVVYRSSSAALTGITVPCGISQDVVEALACTFLVS